MYLTDKITVDGFGELTFEINDDGVFKTINDPNKNFEFLIVVKSLDSNLTSHLMYHHCPVGFDMWTYSYNIFYITDYQHPGIRIEIYDAVNKQLLFSKSYHRTKKYRCLELKSNQFDVTYPPYHTFFNDEYFLKQFNVRDDDVVYDLGANIGAFSIACSNYDVRKIYAFEPHPEIFGYLEYNLDRYAKNVTVYNTAISGKFCKLNFGNTDHGTTSARIRNDGAYSVSAINLESFAMQNKLEIPTYLKIDIEGEEYNFFENTTDEFFRNTHTIFLEFHYNNGSNLLKIINRFKNLGYTLNHVEDALDHTKSHMNTVYLTK